MKALCVLYGGRLEPEAFEKVLPGQAGNESPFSLAVSAARAFPGVEKTVLLGIQDSDFADLPSDVEIVTRLSWTRTSLLEEISRLSVGRDFTYFAWADCPLLDPALAGVMAERHQCYKAEYSYADGWPYGLAPEILGPGIAGILAKLSDSTGSDGPVERDALFQVIQKDINAFDIETEISPVDLRPYRISLTADSKRNLLLLSRVMKELRQSSSSGRISAADIEKLISEKPALLRTLPAFFNIQVLGACPQACSICPWPSFGGSVPVTERKDFMPKAAFGELLDKIAEFAGDAVIDLSLWGELSLHPEHYVLIEMLLARPALSLVIETSGIGWKAGELKALAALQAAPRKNHMAPLSWIVSLDAFDPERYKELRGPGFSEAQDCAKTLLSLFPNDAYVQAVRQKGAEDDIEKFYRFWKGDNSKQIIIQKYDDFAGSLPKLQAADLSPVKRRPCWHIQRDMNILLDGRVPSCREDLAVRKGNAEIWGNAFSDDLSLIWEKGAALYDKHCKAEYPKICALCDEYYTYNF
jgi:spiro-SPASM protein